MKILGDFYMQKQCVCVNNFVESDRQAALLQEWLG